MSALITNDTVCVFLTPIVIQLCERYDLPHGVYLLALATSSNIGSACSPTGNPQNMIIASLSGLKFGDFVSNIITACIVCMCINIGGLILLYRKELVGRTFTPTNGKFLRAPEDEEYVQQMASDQKIAKDSRSSSSTDNVGGRDLEKSNGTIAETQSPSEEPHSVDKQQQHNNNASEVELQAVAVNGLNEMNEAGYDWQNVTHSSSQDDYNESNGHPKARHEVADEEIVGHGDKLRQTSGTSPPPMTAHQPVLRHRVQSKTRTSTADFTGDSHGTDKEFDREAARKKIPSFINDEPMKAEEILKLTERVADEKHPRQQNRRLIMIRCSNPYDFDQEGNVKQPAALDRTFWQKLTHYLMHPDKLGIFTLTLIGVIIAFGVGAPLEWASVGGASAMMLIDWQEADNTISKVDWALLVFFAALFIVVEGLNDTNIPTLIIDALIPYMDIKQLSGLFVYMSIILLGSNTVSNVPLVLILGPFIPGFASPRGSWLLLAFVSTVAGNLTLVGSVANLIVAGRAKNQYFLSFGEYLRFGLPSTLIISVVGSILVWLQVKDA